MDFQQFLGPKLGLGLGSGLGPEGISEVLRTSVLLVLVHSGWVVGESGALLGFPNPGGSCSPGTDLWPGPTLHPMPNTAGAGRGRGCCQI